MTSQSTTEPTHEPVKETASPQLKSISSGWGQSGLITIHEESQDR